MKSCSSCGKINPSEFGWGARLEGSGATASPNCPECVRRQMEESARQAETRSASIQFGEGYVEGSSELIKKVWSVIISVFPVVVVVGLLVFLISKLAVAFSDIAFLKILFGVIFFVVAILFLPYYLVKLRSKVKKWMLIASVFLFLFCSWLAIISPLLEFKR
jgi:hypothetical protein